MQSPKITIITPSLNNGAALEKSIQSVLSQSYPNLEYIIIDGGSTDNTLDIIKKYESKITYWSSEPDKGTRDAVNKGLKMATGEIVNWLYAYDAYAPYALFKVANAFNNKRIKVVAGIGRHKSANGQGIEEETILFPDSLSKSIGCGDFAQPETFFHRSVVEQMGVLDGSLHHLMDRDWWMRYLFLFGLEGIIKIKDHLVNFNINNTTSSSISRHHFETEQNSFFYKLASMHRHYGYAYLLDNYTQVNTSLKLETGAEYCDYLVDEVVNYYVLKQATKFYQAGQHDKVNAFLGEIKVDLLSKRDRAVYKKLRNSRKNFFFNMFARDKKKALYELNHINSRFIVS